MSEQGKRWTKETWLRLAFVGALFLVTVGVIEFHPSPDDTSLGSVLAGLLVLGPFVWPSSFLLAFHSIVQGLLAAVPRCASSALIAIYFLAFWPLFLFVGHRFLLRGRWRYAIPLTVMMVVPATKAATVCDMMMGV